jgi:hypothetical protein
MLFINVNLYYFVCGIKCIPHALLKAIVHTVNMSHDIGAMPPPAGVIPDFDGSTALQHSIVIVYSCTFAIATITMCLRLYSAGFILRKLDWDIR